MWTKVVGFLKGYPLQIQLWIGVIIMVGFSAFATHAANDAAVKAQGAAAAAHADAEVARADAATMQTEICTIAVPSWEIRKQLIADTNEHVHLSPTIDPKSDIGKQLQAQLDANNAQRDRRLLRDTLLNGRKPCQ